MSNSLSLQVVLYLVCSGLRNRARQKIETSVYVYCRTLDEYLHSSCSTILQRGCDGIVN